LQPPQCFPAPHCTALYWVACATLQRIVLHRTALRCSDGLVGGVVAARGHCPVGHGSCRRPVRTLAPMRRSVHNIIACCVSAAEASQVSGRRLHALIYTSHICTHSYMLQLVQRVGRRALDEAAHRPRVVEGHHRRGPSRPTPDYPGVPQSTLQHPRVPQSTLQYPTTIAAVWWATVTPTRNRSRCSRPRCSGFYTRCSGCTPACCIPDALPTGRTPPLTGAVSAACRGGAAPAGAACLCRRGRTCSSSATAPRAPRSARMPPAKVGIG
jgi:hypothetical protein